MKRHGWLAGAYFACLHPRRRGAKGATGNSGGHGGVENLHGLGCGGCRGNPRKGAMNVTLRELMTLGTSLKGFHNQNVLR
jgi:hypothetical protein